MQTTSVNRDYVAGLRIPKNVEVCWNPVRKRCEFHRTEDVRGPLIIIHKMRLVDAAAKGLWACGEEQVMWSCYHAGRLLDKHEESAEPTKWFDYFDANIEPINDLRDAAWWEFTRWQHAGRETARTKLYSEGKMHGEGTATAQDMKWEVLPKTWAGDEAPLPTEIRNRISLSLESGWQYNEEHRSKALYGRATYAEAAYWWKEMNYRKDDLIEFHNEYERMIDEYEANPTREGLSRYNECQMHASILSSMIVSQEQSVEDWFMMIQPGDEPEGLGDEPWYED